MAKPSPKSETPPSSPRLPARPSAGVLLAYRVLKLAAFVVCLPAAVVAVMALIGAVTDNAWVRVAGGVLSMLALPLFIADRLLPAHDPTRARGLVSDVCAVIWTLVVFLVSGVANGTTRPLLAREGDRLVSGGYDTMGTLAYVLAGVKVTSTVAPPPASSGSAVASGSASAPPVMASASAVPSAIVDAGAADAAAVKPKSDKAEKTPADLFKEAGPSVVTIFVFQKGGEGGGTGFLVDREGIIATNHHVIEGASRVRIKFQSGAIFEEVEVLDDVSAVDLALLKVNLAAPVDGGPRVDAAPLPLGDSDGVVVGEHAVSIGNPLGMEHTLTDGLISSRRVYDGRAWIQFSAPISPGNSGGPLFNMRGEVVGITTATITGFGRAQNLNLAVPVNELKKLIRPSYPGRRKLGDGSAPSQW
ncbi:MAG: trypsin-like peptidase domain-containing protein [Minicystis sp.]